MCCNYFVYYYPRSVGTFARALDCTSSVKQPSLHMSAAAASRDVTLVSLHNGHAVFKLFLIIPQYAEKWFPLT